MGISIFQALNAARIKDVSVIDALTSIGGLVKNKAGLWVFRELTSSKTPDIGYTFAAAIFPTVGDVFWLKTVIWRWRGISAPRGTGDLSQFGAQVDHLNGLQAVATTLVSGTLVWVMVDHPLAVLVPIGWIGGGTSRKRCKQHFFFRVLGTGDRSGWWKLRFPALSFQSYNEMFFLGLFGRLEFATISTTSQFTYVGVSENPWKQKHNRPMKQFMVNLDITHLRYPKLGGNDHSFW